MFRIRKRFATRWMWVIGNPANNITTDKAKAMIYSEELPWMWDAELETVPLSEGEVMERQGQPTLFDLEETR